MPPSPRPPPTQVRSPNLPASFSPHDQIGRYPELLDPGRLKYASEEVKRMARLPERRPLILKVKSTLGSLGGGGGRKTQNLLPTLAYLRGERNGQKCGSCMNFTGPFPECVSFEGYFDRACTNCAYNGHEDRCSFKRLAERATVHAPDRTISRDRRGNSLPRSESPSRRHERSPRSPPRGLAPKAQQREATGHDIWPPPNQRGFEIKGAAQDRNPSLSDRITRVTPQISLADRHYSPSRDRERSSRPSDQVIDRREHPAEKKVDTKASGRQDAQLPANCHPPTRNPSPTKGPIAGSKRGAADAFAVGGAGGASAKESTKKEPEVLIEVSSSSALVNKDSLLVPAQGPDKRSRLISSEPAADRNLAPAPALPTPVSAHQGPPAKRQKTGDPEEESRSASVSSKVAQKEMMAPPSQPRDTKSTTQTTVSSTQEPQIVLPAIPLPTSTPEVADKPYRLVAPWHQKASIPVPATSEAVSISGKNTSSPPKKEQFQDTADSSSPSVIRDTAQPLEEAAKATEDAVVSSESINSKASKDRDTKNSAELGTLFDESSSVVQPSQALSSQERSEASDTNINSATNQTIESHGVASSTAKSGSHSSPNNDTPQPPVSRYDAMLAEVMVMTPQQQHEELSALLFRMSALHDAISRRPSDTLR